MVKVSASLLNANEDKILETIKKIENAKIDFFHIDVMDGEFVKHDTHDKMLKICEYISSVSRTPMDVHIMVKDIKNFVDSYAIFNPNIITFHYEACKSKEQVKEIIEYIKGKVRRVGMSIKPSTKVDDIKEFLPYLHQILVMTVEPGEGVQELLQDTVEKIKELDYIRNRERYNFDIEADGGINVENAEKIKEAGADIIVSGTAIIKSNDYSKTIKELKY